MNLYDSVAINYNLTRKADPYIANKLFQLLNSSFQAEKEFLDVGCGTGNYTLKLSSLGLNFCGIDPSIKMIEIAKVQSNKIDWKVESAEQISYSSSRFSGILAVLTIHHWRD